MTSLDEAWKWYEDTRGCLILLRRLGDKYWDELPWGGPLGRDDRFQSMEGPVVRERADHSLRYLDDLAVLVLFSVFESVVRDRVLSEIQDERSRLTHPQLVRIIDDSLDGIQNGSFFRIMEAFKGKDPGLVEEVNQVRRYRNWVAHGRRSDQPPLVEPRVAYDRLRRFLHGLPEGPG
jgi:hypothetical protein